MRKKQFISEYIRRLVSMSTIAFSDLCKSTFGRQLEYNQLKSSGLQDFQPCITSIFYSYPDSTWRVNCSKSFLTYHSERFMQERHKKTYIYFCINILHSAKVYISSYVAEQCKALSSSQQVPSSNPGYSFCIFSPKIDF